MILIRRMSSARGSYLCGNDSGLCTERTVPDYGIYAYLVESFASSQTPRDFTFDAICRKRERKAKRMQ